MSGDDVYFSNQEVYLFPCNKAKVADPKLNESSNSLKVGCFVWEVGLERETTGW